ncbi:MAG TPA: phage virion morphogenesis protein [Planctomycetaceae bacterium]|nr:phage virion morphogenesis protein [Planctomycetaceae bacterium]
MRTDRIKEEDWPRYLADYLATDDRSDYSVVLDHWHTELQGVAMTAFAGEISPHGSPWLPWEWESWRTRSLNPGGHPTLDATGRLRGSLVRKGSENIDAITPKESQYGSSVPYAGLHNDGGAVALDQYMYHRTDALAPKKPGSVMQVSQREFLDVTPEMADAMANAVADFLVQQLEG